MLGLVLSILCCVLYVIETALQIHIALNRTNIDLVIILPFVAAPLFIVNIISAVLVFRTMDFTGKGSARLICIILHSLQVGLLWRSVKLLIIFDQHDWRDFVILRLILTVLQSFPVIVFKGSHFFNGMDMSVEVIFLVIISIISSGIVYSMYNTENILFDFDEFSGLSTQIRKPFGVVVMTFGTVLLLFSRCGSIVVLFSIKPALVSIPLSIHFILYFLSSTFYYLLRKKGNLLQVLKSFALSYLNIFDILNKDNQKLACENVLLYSCILVENIIMTGYWLLNNDWDYRYQLTATVSIILTFLCGMFLKCCSCNYIQNDKFEPFSEAVFQVALEISTKDRNKIEIQNHEQYLDYENHCATINVRNGYIHKTPGMTYIEEKCKRGGVNFDENIKSDSVRKKRNTESNLDIASSNSRNTNTLNISNPINSPESPSKHRKSPLPLFPNECSNYLPNRTFESKHVLSNSTDKESDTSYSSYSYYTDWSSCDSTWTDTMTFINLHNLPTEKVSATDSVQLWLSMLSQWDHDIDSLQNEHTSINRDSLQNENTSNNRDSLENGKTLDGRDSLENGNTFNNRDSSENENTVDDRDSLENNQTHTNDLKRKQNFTKTSKYKRESNIVLNPNEAFHQYCNTQKDSSKKSYLPYNLSDMENTQHENSLRICQDKNQTAVNTIQESMV